MLNYQAGRKFPFVERKLEIEARMQEFANAGSIEVSVGPTKVLVDYPRSEENLQISKLENWAPYHHPEKLLQFIIWKIPTNSGDIWSGKLYEILSWKWDSVPKVTPIVVFDTQLVQIPFCHQLQATSPVVHCCCREGAGWEPPVKYKWGHRGHFVENIFQRQWSTSIISSANISWAQQRDTYTYFINSCNDIWAWLIYF